MTTWYVSPSGSQSNTGAIGSPWPLDYAASSAGARIVPGDTVVLRGGSYDGNFLFSLSGSPGSPITFVAADGEVPSIDSSYVAMRSIGNAEWELYDAPSNTWRSTATSFSGDYFGHIKIDDEWWPLATHQELADLMATREDYSATLNYYVGPGIDESAIGGRLYIRLVNSDPGTMFGRDVPQIANPDPRQNEIRLSGVAATCSITGSHLVFDGIDVNESFTLWQLVGSPTNLTFRNCTGRPGYHVSRMGNATDVTWYRCEFDGRMVPDRWWVDHSSIKAGRTVADSCRKNAFDFDATTNLTISECTLSWFFDGMVGNGPLVGARVNDNTWRCWDDCWQMYGNVSQAEFLGNLCLGAGPSCDAAYSTSPVDVPGQVYIGFNVIDTTTWDVWWGRRGGGYDSTDGYDEPIPFSTHGQIGASGWAFPRAIYHNTIICNRPHNPYLDIGFFGVATAGNFYSDAQHLVLNNIIRMGAYVPPALDANIATGREVWDGNAYWADTDGGYGFPVRPHRRVTGSAGQFLGGTRGPTLTELQSGTLLSDAQAYYAPGWEDGAVIADPLIGVNYRPTATSCRSGAVDITRWQLPRAEAYVQHRGAKSEALAGWTVTLTT